MLPPTMSTTPNSPTVCAKLRTTPVRMPVSESGRTTQIDAFATETSCLTIVWAVMQDIRLPKIPVG